MLMLIIIIFCILQQLVADSVMRLNVNRDHFQKSRLIL